MGRYSVGLAAQLADLAGVTAGQRALDVGCGPGALTRELVARLGAERRRRRRSVGAVRRRGARAESGRRRAPAPPPSAAVRRRRVRRRARAARRALHGGPGRRAARDGARHAARRRRRGVRVGPRRRPGPARRVLAGRARSSTPRSRDESDLAGAREGHLRRAVRRGRAPRDRADRASAARVEHPSFEEWWEPFTFGVGPAGAYVAGLAADDSDRLRERCRVAAPRAAVHRDRARLGGPRDASSGRCVRRRYARAFSRPPQTCIEHHVLVWLTERS